MGGISLNPKQGGEENGRKEEERKGWKKARYCGAGLLINNKKGSGKKE